MGVGVSHSGPLPSCQYLTRWKSRRDGIVLDISDVPIRRYFGSTVAGAYLSNKSFVGNNKFFKGLLYAGTDLQSQGLRNFRFVGYPRCEMA